MKTTDWTRAFRDWVGLGLHRRRRRKSPKNRRPRNLVVEKLDAREMLTATVMYQALVVQAQFPSAADSQDAVASDRVLYAAPSLSINAGEEGGFWDRGMRRVSSDAKDTVQQSGEGAGGSARHVLSTGFVVEPGAAFVPPKTSNYSSTVPIASVTAQSWVDEQGVEYVASIHYDSTLIVAATGADEKWTHTETLDSAWLVTINGSDGSVSFERDTYGYTFVASGGLQDSTFTFTVHAGGKAFGSAARFCGPLEELAARAPSLLYSGEGGTLDSIEEMWPWNWDWEQEYQQIIANGGSSGSGSAHESYSSNGPYSYAVEGGEVAGTFQESGVYDYSYSYETTATSSSGGWIITGSGSSRESGQGHYSYEGSGSYAYSGSGSGSGSGSASGWDAWSLNGTIDESGGDDDYYDYTTQYTLDASGSWGVTGGSGWASGNGNTSWSYSGDGDYTVDYGDYAIDGTFGESGGDDTSYEFETSATADSDGHWSETGTGTDVENVNHHFSFSGSGSYAASGSGMRGESGWETWSMSGTVNESGADDSNFDYTTGYALDSSDGWGATGGSGDTSRSGDTHWSFSGQGEYTLEVNGGSISGTSEESEEWNTSYEFQTAETLGSDGDWTASGTGTEIEDGNRHLSYSGSGSYSREVAGGTVSGALSESGGDDSWYQYTKNYTLENDVDWALGSGSGSGSGSSSAHRSFSGSGSYSRTDGSTYAIDGTVQESGNDDWEAGYITTATLDSEGNWAESGDASDSGSGLQTFSYSGSGSFSSSTGTSSNWSNFNSTVEEDGGTTFSYEQTDDWTLVEDQWALTYAEDSATTTTNAHFNYSASGSSFSMHESPGYGTGNGTHSETHGSFSQSVDRTASSESHQHGVTEPDGSGVLGTTRTLWGSNSSSGTADYHNASSTDYTTLETSQYHTMVQTGNSFISLTTHDQFDYHDEWSQTIYPDGSGSYSSGSGGTNDVSGSTTLSSGGSCTRTDTYYPYSGSGSASTTTSSYAWSGTSSGSYSETVGYSGFYSAAYYPGPHRDSLGVVPAAGSPWYDSWYLPVNIHSSGSGSGSGSGMGMSEEEGPQAGAGETWPGVMTYDDQGRPASVTDAQGGVTVFTYDAAGNLASLTDPDGNTTTWLYDGENRLIAELDTLGHARYYSYDLAGNLARYTDRNGRVRQYEYDAQGRVIAEAWYDNAKAADAGEVAAEVIKYAYDVAGRVVSESDSSSARLYSYDDQGRVQSVTTMAAGSPTVVLTSDYTGDSLVRSEVTASIDATPDFANGYSYDDGGRLLTITQTASAGGVKAEKQVDFAYDRQGNLATVSRYLAGLSVADSAFRYGRFGRLAGLVHSQGETVLAEYAWNYGGGDWLPGSAGRGGAAPVWGAALAMPIVVTHDPAQISLSQLGSSPLPSRLLTDARSPDGWAHYTYDRLGQLTGAQFSTDGPAQADESYRYNANGNRADWERVVGADNQLVSDGNYKYEYDAEGNRVRRVDVATGAVTEYTWDARNRLVLVADYAPDAGEATQIVSFFYDAQNHWIGEDIDGNGDGVVDHQTRFAYDGDQIALEFDKEGAGTLTAADLSHRFLWGAAVDQLLADERTLVDEKGGMAPQVLWALTDHLGSVRDVARLDGTTAGVVNHVVFGSFGQIVSESNPAEGTLFGFTGRPADGATGLRNHLNRWTDPSTGDWMSEDPMGFTAGDANIRRYVGNAPTVFVDPTGLWFYQGDERWLAESGDDFYSLVTLVDPNLAPHKNAMAIRPVDPSDPDLEFFMRLFWGDVNKTGDVPMPYPGGEYDASNLVARRNPSGDPINDAVRVSVGTDTNGYIAGAADFFGVPGGEEGRRFNEAGQLAQFLRNQSQFGRAPIGSLIIIGHSSKDKNAIGGRGDGAYGSATKFKLDELWMAAKTQLPDPNRNLIGDSKNLLAYWPTFNEALAGQLPPVAWLATDAVVYLVGCSTDKFATTIATNWLRSNEAVAWGTLRDTWLGEPNPFPTIGWAAPGGGLDPTIKVSNSDHEYLSRMHVYTPVEWVRTRVPSPRGGVTLGWVAVPHPEQSRKIPLWGGHRGTNKK